MTPFRRRSKRLILILLTVPVFVHFHWKSDPGAGQENFQVERSSPVIQSTCSHKADRRQYHQSIISFSIYGDLFEPRNFARYVTPLLENVKRISEVYPDWTVRIYHNLEDDEAHRNLTGLFGTYPHVDLCNASQVLIERNLTLKTFPMNWRFLPLIDPTVDRFMSRDSDSLIIEREVEAVRQWIGSSFPFHVMRDHPSHCTPILGGLFGIKVSLRRQAVTQAITHLLKKKTRNLKGIDQFLLRRHLWPVARQEVLAHDSYCCHKFPDTRPFPTQRVRHLFVGMVSVDDFNAQPVECPSKCRPPNLNWTYC